ncbi:hypothetical protein ACSNOK_01900 [Streptomyces sp. URMC 126]|uniref:hypothetical protein n=1 Tax=Streptomyces sp. URMC 126 TaxID=3423401 RepID=UPI003F19F534
MATELPVGQRPTRYAPRSVRTLAYEEVGGWTVKRYSVSALRELPPAEVHAFARDAVRRSLPAPHDEGPAHAFSVVHEDEDGVYAVVGWWSVNRLILHTRTWLADWTGLRRPTEAPAHATACVWELAAIGRERDAWVEHVVQNDPPDYARYLAAGIDGAY